MAVFRIERTRDYTVMSNHHLRNGKLSLKAKGLLSMMLSLPEDWNYTTRGLAAICKEGVDAIGGALRELETAGYIVRYQLRDRQGRISDTEYVIYEQPQPKKNPKCNSPHIMDADLLMQTIAEVLKKIEDYSISNRAEFEALVKKNLAMQQTDQTKKQQKRIPQITTRLEQIHILVLYFSQRHRMADINSWEKKYEEA